MSRESLIDDHNNHNIEYERNQLIASAVGDDRLKNSVGGNLGPVNYSKLNTV